MSDSRVSISQVLEGLSRDPSWGNVTTLRTLAPRRGRSAPLPPSLHPSLRELLSRRGIGGLYSHQAEVWDLVAGGRDVVIATPTASGKSLAFHLPVFQSLQEDRTATALCLFPTKALARDQLEGMRDLWPGPRVEVDVYDGDTSQSARRRIRSACRVLITNPDMLHVGLLPHHPSWSRFFSGLGHVVIDEVHHYRGVFGSHAANVLRRLRRVCGFHGGRPLFIAASATIANPAELTATLTGSEPAAVLESGAPSGRKEFVFYNPPLVDRERGIRAGNWWETVRLVLPFLRAGRRAIVFARSRVETEIVLTYLQEALKKEGLPPSWVKGYRGGYLPAERRAIEEELRTGALRAVVSTTALELGIDIGGLDVCVMSGYPGSVASAWQQAGRAGRRFDDSAAFLVAENSPLDQFIVTHPDYFFGQPPEAAALNPDNPDILASHLACAAFELPLGEEEQFGGRDPSLALEAMAGEGRLHRSGGSWHWVGGSYPAAEISLRSATAAPFTLVDAGTGEGIGVIDGPSAPLLAHEQAVYFHGGRSFVIESCDETGRVIRARPAEVDYFTEPVVSVRIDPGEQEEAVALGGVVLGWGAVDLITRVTGFRRMKLFTHQHLGEELLDLPESRMATTACSLTAGGGAAGGEGFAVMQGVGYLLSRVAPLYVLCDGRDVRSYSQGTEGGARLTLHLCDNYPGGAGFSPRLFESFASLVTAAAEVARSCPCRDGCPSCFGPELAGAGRLKDQAAGFLEWIEAQMGEGGERRGRRNPRRSRASQ